MRSRRLEIYICIALVIAILAVYGQIWDYPFINFDDPDYVTKNQIVRKGLSLENISWALTATEASNWHPLTWLSHMADCELFGLNPGAHHLISLFFHIMNTLLIFIVFRMMTGALWRSAFVAALFALHPLHIESVAWVAERKDVLSAFFWMLTMWGYVRYARRPGIATYLPVLLFFTMGLMSKPMVVTLPFVLLLMDWWPLGRLRWGGGVSSWLRLIREKLPLFILSAASGVVTFLAQQGGGAVSSLGAMPLKARMANALISYVTYLGKMVWPQKLAIFYPHPGMAPVWEVLGAVVLLIVVSVLVIRIAKRHAYLAVGWLWYLGTLVPVIGLIQVGRQSMADRYTYLPLIGIAVMFAWGVPALAARLRHRGAVLGAAGASILAILMAVAWVQAGYWKDSATLWRHTLAVTVNNDTAHYNLGATLSEQGDTEQAIEQYHRALRIRPGYAEAHYNLGIALQRQGDAEQAMEHYRRALHVRPGYAEARVNLANVLVRQGHTAQAMEYYSEALRINPDGLEVHYNLVLLLERQGRIGDALKHLYEALRADPGNQRVHVMLGNILTEQGRIAEAIDHYAEAVRIKPDDADAHFRFGFALAKQGDATVAVRHYTEAMRLNPDAAAIAWYNIACVYAVQNKTAESVDALREAITRGFDDWDHIRADAELENIRDSAAYRELLGE